MPVDLFLFSKTQASLHTDYHVSLVSCNLRGSSILPTMMFSGVQAGYSAGRLVVSLLTVPSGICGRDRKDVTLYHTKKNVMLGRPHAGGKPMPSKFFHSQFIMFTLQVAGHWWGDTWRRRTYSINTQGFSDAII